MLGGGTGPAHGTLATTCTPGPANIARMLMTGRLAGTGKMIILPVDQGFEHGPARSFAPNPAARRAGVMAA